jgi:arylamine N-acetyltransferase
MASVAQTENEKDTDHARVEKYLQRIGYQGPPPYVVGEDDATALEVLRGLHWAHLLSVPFENLR